jgi:hypothetical protein
MKKSLLAIVIALFMAVPAFSVGPPGSGGVSSGIQTAADCNVAAYYAIGTLCQQTGDGKLFKGTGAAVEEITAGVGIAADGSVPFTGKETFGAGLATKNGTTSPGFIDFYEDGDEAGSHYFRLYGPEALADSIFIKLPAMAGNTGGMLYFSAANTLSIAGAGAQGKIWQMGAAIPAWSTGVLTEGANTFNYTLGTASLDVAAGAALNIDTSLQTTTGAIILVGQAGGSSVTVPASGTLATTTYVPTTITVADTADTTTFVSLFEDATGDRGPKTDAGITYNASSGMLTVTGLTTGAGGITTASSDSPTDSFLDTQAPGADKEIAKIVGGYVDGADGAENGTLDLYAHEAGTSTSYATIDGKNVKFKINKKLETVGVIELGHASDTTLARVSPGVVSIETVNVVTVSSTDTLTNKTLTAPLATLPRVDGKTALTLTAAQVSGTVIRNTGQSLADVNHTLPQAAAGYNFIAFVGTTLAATNYWRFTADNSPQDYMCLDGTCGKTYVSVDTPTMGDTLTCYTEQMSGTGLKNEADLGIGTTANTSVKNTVAVEFDIAGTGYSKAVAETAPGNDTIPQNKYGAVAFDIGANGTIDAIEATANATGYNSAALAIEGIPAVEAAHTRLGTVTAMSTEAGGFVFGTTALNAANTTVAYTDAAIYTPSFGWVCITGKGTWTTN